MKSYIRLIQKFLPQAMLLPLQFLHKNYSLSKSFLKQINDIFRKTLVGSIFSQKFSLRKKLLNQNNKY